MDIIDRYIEEQKKTKHSPYLESRIVAKVESLKSRQNKRENRMPIWYYPAIAVCLVGIIALGITIGNRYESPEGNYAGILVNDTYIEQLSMYEQYADE